LSYNLTQTLTEGIQTDSKMTLVQKLFGSAGRHEPKLSISCAILASEQTDGIMQGCFSFEPEMAPFGSRIYTHVLGIFTIISQDRSTLKIFLKLPGYSFVSQKDTSSVLDVFECYFTFGTGISGIPFWFK